MEVLPTEGPGQKLQRLSALISDAAVKLRDDPVIVKIEEEVAGLEEVIDRQERADEAARVLLGPLAAAGMAALALEHENRKDVVRASQRMAKLKLLAEARGDTELTHIVQDLSGWLDRLEQGRRLFAPLIDADERDRVEALPASGVLREIVANLKSLMLGMPVDLEIPRDLLLPSATFAEWHAIFQNVLLNAANAMLDTAEPRILVEGGRTGRKAWVRVSDRGIGVDLETQTKLFEPFSRKHDISADRQALGLGGMGLGLTIVRMIAHQRRCSVAFVMPPNGWRSTFELNWTVSS
jgi:signal transduction histidine kinase